MMNAETKNMAGGLLGTTGGGFAWVVVTGFVTGTPIVSLLAVILGVVCFAGSMALFRARPERRLMIIGLAFIWIALFNIIFINLIYNRIPDTVAGITTGKEALSSLNLTVLMAAFAVLGFAMVARDFLHMGDQD